MGGRSKSPKFLVTYPSKFSKVRKVHVPGCRFWDSHGQELDVREVAAITPRPTFARCCPAERCFTEVAKKLGVE